MNKGVSGETLVSLGNHRALPIKMLYDQLHNEIHSYVNPKILNNITINDPTVDLQLDKQGLQTWPVLDLIEKGEQECVELTMADGRKLICTENQKVLTTTGWKPVSKLTINKDIVNVGIDLPTFISDDNDVIEEKDWTFSIDEYTFKMNNQNEISKSLAFGRFLGYLLADGTLVHKEGTKSYTIVMYMGSIIDAHTMVNDIYTIFNTNIRYVYCKGTYRISMGAKISRTISKIPGIPYGARIYKESHLPEFIFTAPKLMIAHFFAGLFGGDGCSPSSRYTKRFELRHTVDFIFSKVETLSDNSSTYKKEIINLLQNLNIIATETKPRLRPIKLDGLVKYSYVINVSDKSVNTYANTIGFSHCISKASRLFASYALINLDYNISTQNLKIIQLFDNYTNFSQVQTNATRLKLINFERAGYIKKHLRMTTIEGYNMAIENYKKDNLAIGTFIIKHAVTDFLCGITKKQISKSNYENLLREWDSYHWFRNEDRDDNKNSPRGISGQKIAGTVYATTQHQLTIPTMKMKVLSIKLVGLKPVYNLRVPLTHNFVANGIIVHDDYEK